MNQANSVAFLAQPIPRNLQALFRKRPIVFGESSKLYDTLLARVAAEAKPEDTFEWFLIKDVVDLTWENQRLRKFQAVIIQDAMEANLVEVLRPDDDDEPDNDDEPADDEPEINYYRLVRQYFSRNPKAKREVTAILAKRGIELNIDFMMTRAFEKELSTLEITSKMIAELEARRERVLREIDRRRQFFGIRTRQAIEKESQDSDHGSNVAEEPESATRQLTSNS